MYMVKDTYISLENIRKMHHETDMLSDYIVITYAYDKENPTRIAIGSREEYFDVAHEISTAVREREGK